MMATRRAALALTCAALATSCAPTAPAAPTEPSTPAAPSVPTAAPTPIAPVATSVPTRPVLTVVPTVQEVVPTPAPTPAPARSLVGVDILLRDGLPLLDAKRLGLITNATGKTASGQSTIDALNSAFNVGALFSPEHGIRGDAAAGQAVDASTDAQTGLPVYSLYGNTTRPTDAMLRGFDALVYDIQDVGTRTYTYTSTLLEVMKAAAQHGIPVVVLDRPDPIAGDVVQGNVLDPRFASFVGPAPIAMRYGMTIGELGQYFNAELHVGAQLHVVQMEGWRRSMWFDETGLDWVNPSPNIRSLSAAGLYPGTVLFEGTNLSVGRGTEAPFEWLGAPWLDPADWLSRLTAPGVHFAIQDRTPDSDAFAGQLCHGLSITVADRGQLQPMALGVALLCALPNGLKFDVATFDGLAGTDQVRKQILAGTPAEQIAAAWQPDLNAFTQKRQPYLIY